MEGTVAGSTKTSVKTTKSKTSKTASKAAPSEADSKQAESIQADVAIIVEAEVCHSYMSSILIFILFILINNLI